MDLPWSSMKKILCNNIENKKKKIEENTFNNQKKVNFIEDKKPTKEQLIATDEEILRKFKLIMSQNNARKSANAISPTF